MPELAMLPFPSLLGGKWWLFIGGGLCVVVVVVVGGLGGGGYGEMPSLGDFGGFSC